MATKVTIPEREELRNRYTRIRRRSEALCEPLEIEDFVVQSMPDVSPVKWHLAHTTWFFETFLLSPHLPGYEVMNPQYEVLFNSYYNAIGPQFDRPDRGLLSRPTVKEILAYRRRVDEGVQELLRASGAREGSALRPLLILGLNHEQQHQELLLTDIKHVFSMNPLKPVYQEPAATQEPAGEPPPVGWHAHAGGLMEIGHEGSAFAFDNESPRHRVWLEPFRLASRPVCCGELLDFMADGGYQRPECWLSEGWDAVQQCGWRAPLYWEERDGQWQVFTLTGPRPVRRDEPVCHVSYFEADACARWLDARLPGEAEWEVVAAAALAEAGEEAVSGSFADDPSRHPRPLPAATGGQHPTRLLGDVWEWTSSPYAAYPGFRPTPGALGEYNAKFMSSQLVLRGGSCATPRDHVRSTYRNFFPPAARWQFSGFRLARDGDA